MRRPGILRGAVLVRKANGLWLAALLLGDGLSVQAAPALPPATLWTHGSLTVAYRDARDAGQLATVGRAWDAAVRDLRALGLSVPAAVRIEAASNAQDFAARTGEGPGTAASTRGNLIRMQRLSALAARGLLPFTVRHEVFHTAQPAGLPRWLAEGLARTFSGEAVQDAPTPPGLHALSTDALDRQLLARGSPGPGAAYREATRRAGLLLRRCGWRAVLAGAGR